MKKYTREQLNRLNADEKFQKKVSKDELLNKLFSAPEKTDKEFQAELILCLGGVPTINGNILLSRITPGIICLLGMIKSPFLFGGLPSMRDIDAALYIFSKGKEILKNCNSPESIFEKSTMYSKLNELKLVEVAEVIQKLINISFAGYDYFPEITGPALEPNLYDAEWLTRQIRLVSEVSNYTPEQIKWEVSMTEISYYAVQFGRKNGQQNIKRPCRSRETMERLRQLMDEQLAEYAKNG